MLHGNFGPKLTFFLAGCLFLLFQFGSILSAEEAKTNTAPGRKMARQAIQGNRPWVTADHTKHEALKQEFHSGDDITRACLSCHSEAAA